MKPELTTDQKIARWTFSVALVILFCLGLFLIYTEYQAASLTVTDAVVIDKSKNRPRYGFMVYTLVVQTEQDRTEKIQTDIATWTFCDIGDIVNKKVWEKPICSSLDGLSSKPAE